jgi:alpha,alpha-trehalase
MKVNPLILSIALLFISFIPQSNTSHYRPAEQLEELFTNIQLGHVFPDSKTFVDARPKFAPEQILQKYRKSRDKKSFRLDQFVAENFKLPGHSESNFALNPNLSMAEHIINHWDYLTREADEKENFSSLIPLPNDYIVPGGRFREIYYWDSYFTMHGLAASGRKELVKSMLNNFAYLIDELGFIPNGNRTYYLSRSQPPFFSSMVALYQHHHGTQAALPYLPQLLKEYSFWMEGLEDVNARKQAAHHVVRMPDGSILNRYYDRKAEPRPESYAEDVELASHLPEEERARLYTDIRSAAESGWDFSSRWFKDNNSLASIHTTDIIPVDLNSLLYHLETTISELYFAGGQEEKANRFEKLALQRKAAIEKWLWDEQRQFYIDYDFVSGAPTPSLSLAAVYPLYYDIASEERAQLVGKKLASDFLKAGGLVTTLAETGEQWDSPNGWAPLQWLAVKGLENYDMPELSQEIAARWLKVNRKVFQETGKMMEKYNVVDTTLIGGGGEYPLQDGFGWTNGVDIALINRE